MRRYSVTYKIDFHDPGLTVDELEVKPDDLGACDAAVIISHVYDDDGWFSQAVISVDGRTNEPVSPNNLWKSWFLLAKDLADMTELSQYQRDLCQMVFKTVCESITAEKKN